MKNFKILFLIMALLMFMGCSNKDLETIDNESPNNKESLIIYTDIEPDYVSNNLNDSYVLDLNNDGIVDFSLKSEPNLLNWDYNDPIIFPQYILILDSGSNDASGIISVTPGITTQYLWIVVRKFSNLGALPMEKPMKIGVFLT